MPTSKIPEHLSVPRLTRSELPEYLKQKHGLRYTEGTLAAYATRGTGPAYVKAGQRVFYEPAAADRWVAKIMSRPAHKASEIKGGGNA